MRSFADQRQDKRGSSLELVRGGLPLAVNSPLIQIMHTAVRTPLGQYLIGALVNLIYVIILISNQTSFQNIQVPENNYSQNLWQGTDVLGYIRPAQNFVDHRIFGYGNIPDYRRTIGYPLFLSVLMMVFGEHWLIVTIFIQALIFAVMYPLLARTARILFNANDQAITLSFLFLILSGTYIVMVPMMLTDTFFTVFFTLGLWLGLESIAKRRYVYFFLHIIFMGYAAQVRPLLSLYPFISCLLLIFVAKKYAVSRFTSTNKMILISVISLLIICNLSSVRNYINHNFPRPTDTLSNDMFYQLAKDVLLSVNKSDEYNEMAQVVRGVGVNDLNKKINLQEKLAFNIYKEYPLTTLKEMTHNAIGILGRAHWPVVAHFWGYSFLNSISPGLMPLKKSTGIYLIEVFFNLVYLFVYLLCLSFLVRVFRSGNIMLALTLIFFIAYFVIPGFIGRGAGSRYRLPVEGLIVIMASCEFEHYCKILSNKLYVVINRLYTLLRVLIPLRRLKGVTQQGAQDSGDRHRSEVGFGLDRLVMATLVVYRAAGWRDA
jgi:Dolichyl-phosphate-mannose-protein mannosyltransferase